MRGLILDLEDGGEMFSETSVELQQATQSYIPKDRTVQRHRFENLKYYLLVRSTKCGNVTIMNRGQKGVQNSRMFGKHVLGLVQFWVGAAFISLYI